MQVMPRHRVAFVVNGGLESAMAERARSFADRLGDRFVARLVLRTGGRFAAARSALQEVTGFRPNLCYVLDLAAAGVVTAGAYRSLCGCPFVLDFGDAVVELGRALGRGQVATAATRGLEAFALRAASAVVVRGSFHSETLARRGVRAEFVPDGVAVRRFDFGKDPELLDRGLVIGLVGSSVWVPTRGTCYGWELVELVALLRGRLPFPVKGVLVGDGSGVEFLRRRAAELGVVDAVTFAGRVRYEDLPVWIKGFHVCLSTQTNDVIGNVRTTGKLPLYLAAGRFILASRVGEAARILPAPMLVDYAGETDPGYPTKLADRISELVAAGERFRYHPECVRLAEHHFEYDRLAPRVGTVIERVLRRKQSQ